MTSLSTFRKFLTSTFTAMCMASITAPTTKEPSVKVTHIEPEEVKSVRQENDALKAQIAELYALLASSKTTVEVEADTTGEADTTAA